MKEPLSSVNICTKLERIAKQAREAPQMAFRTLAHYIDMEWMHEAYRQTRKNGAAGVDGQSGEQYAVNLEENLRTLLERAKAGTYRAPPVRRVHIPKGSGEETRPLGIPTFEDKVLQRAVVMVLEAIYETDFLDVSYGFRRGRSAHQLLSALQTHLVMKCGGWILEVDIRKFFDSVDHGRLLELLRRRVHDGVILRLVSKWLHAGVLEQGLLMYPETGTPQGGVISPLLANIFLHEVLDTWFEREVEPRMWSEARLFRYADDAVLCFTNEADAHRVMAVLPKRFEKYGLTLHPEKTRLLEFRRPDRLPLEHGKLVKPSTFDLLGFTHHWGKTRSGKWAVKRKTAKDRFRRGLQRIYVWCKQYRHAPVREQWVTLVQKLRGHFGYFGIIGNSMAVDRFRNRVLFIWCRWLRRRSQRASRWDRVHALLTKYPLPHARLTPSLAARAANP